MQTRPEGWCESSSRQKEKPGEKEVLRGSGFHLETRSLMCHETYLCRYTDMIANRIHKAGCRNGTEV